MIKVAIGQDSHRFDLENTGKGLFLCGICFSEEMSFVANSDGDVVLHAVTNAISGITGRNILGKVADKMCKLGITDSVEYLKVALEDLGNLKGKIVHLSVSIEALKPKLECRIGELRVSLAKILGIGVEQIGLTATTGEGLTEFGKGLGMQVFCVLTVDVPQEIG